MPQQLLVDELILGGSSLTVEGGALKVDGGGLTATGAEWGDITGTIAEQTDLTTLLGTRQPLTTELTNFTLNATAVTAASTTSIGSVAGRYVQVNHASGTVNLSLLGNVTAGVEKVVRFAVTGGTLNLIHGASLVLPGAVNISSVTNGTVMIFRAVAANMWQAIAYQNGSITGTGSDVKSASPTFTGTPVTSPPSDVSQTEQIATTSFAHAAANSKFFKAANYLNGELAGDYEPPTPASITVNLADIYASAVDGSVFYMGTHMSEVVTFEFDFSNDGIVSGEDAITIPAASLGNSGAFIDFMLDSGHFYVTGLQQAIDEGDGFLKFMTSDSGSATHVSFNSSTEFGTDGNPGGTFGSAPLSERTIDSVPVGINYLSLLQSLTVSGNGAILTGVDATDLAIGYIDTQLQIPGSEEVLFYPIASISLSELTSSMQKYTLGLDPEWVFTTGSLGIGNDPTDGRVLLAYGLYYANLTIRLYGPSGVQVPSDIASEGKIHFWARGVRAPA